MQSLYPRIFRNTANNVIKSGLLYVAHIRKLIYSYAPVLAQFPYSVNVKFRVVCHTYLIAIIFPMYFDDSNEKRLDYPYTG